MILRHAEQLLFSCVSSKWTVCDAVTSHMPVLWALWHCSLSWGWFRCLSFYCRTTPSLATSPMASWSSHWRPRWDPDSSGSHESTKLRLGSWLYKELSVIAPIGLCRWPQSIAIIPLRKIESGTAASAHVWSSLFLSKQEQTKLFFMLPFVAEWCATSTELLPETHKNGFRKLRFLRIYLWFG